PGGAGERRRLGLGAAGRLVPQRAGRAGGGGADRAAPLRAGPPGAVSRRGGGSLHPLGAGAPSRGSHLPLGARLGHTRPGRAAAGPRHRPVRRLPPTGRRGGWPVGTLRADAVGYHCSSTAGSNSSSEGRVRSARRSTSGSGGQLRFGTATTRSAAARAAATPAVESATATAGTDATPRRSQARRETA